MIFSKKTELQVSAYDIIISVQTLLQNLRCRTFVNFCIGINKWPQWILNNFTQANKD